MSFQQNDYLYDKGTFKYHFTHRMGAGGPRVIVKWYGGAWWVITLHIFKIYVNQQNTKHEIELMKMCWKTVQQEWWLGEREGDDHERKKLSDTIFDSSLNNS